MKFKCCGLIHNTNDVETFESIEKDVISNPTVKDYNGRKITKEIVYTLTCKKNGCTQVKIFRMGLSAAGKSIALDKIELSGISAIEYLQETEELRKRQPQICPIKPIPFCKRIPLVFGKVISSTEQRKRYVNEQGFRDISESRIILKGYRDDKGKVKFKKVIEYEWVPDIVVSPINYFYKSPPREETAVPQTTAVIP